MTTNKTLRLTLATTLRSVGVLSKLRYVLSSTTLRNSMFSMVHPYLLHGTADCGNTFDKNLKRLIAFQNRAIKILVEGKRRDHATQYYKQPQILKLKDLHVYEVVLMY